ncbi:MAG: hypothetical protein A2W09_08875 [Deltaproteobacteria bacterium RBG_16_50_11]|nr:MAG: hypothetical protein A2W09_08875 [Deltaproteobacteria bacterium RBG_16_50_11]
MMSPRSKREDVKAIFHCANCDDQGHTRLKELGFLSWIILLPLFFISSLLGPLFFVPGQDSRAVA